MLGPTEIKIYYLKTLLCKTGVWELKKSLQYTWEFLEIIQKKDLLSISQGRTHFKPFCNFHDAIVVWEF